MACLRRRLLLAVGLAVAALAVGVAAAFTLRSCEELQAGADGDSSPTGGPSPSPVLGFCITLSPDVLSAGFFFLGIFLGAAWGFVYFRFADGDDESAEAACRAMKAGYVAISGDYAEAGSGGGKN